MKKKIMIIDDQEDLVELTRRLLESRGYQVIALTESQQALEEIKTALPDLIIMDMLMPDKDGAEICHEIKNDSAVRHIPVILTSGQFLDESVFSQDGLSRADDYLMKPFEIDDLLEKVKKFVG